MKDYHEITGHVSNSSLNILEKSPRMFKEFLDGTYEQAQTNYYDFGEAVHMYLLEPERYKKEVVVVDYTTPKSSQQRSFIEDFVELKKKHTTKESMKLAFEKTYKPNKAWEVKAKELINTYKPYIRYLKNKQNKLILDTKMSEKVKSIGEEVKGHQMASKLLSDPSIVADETLRFNELQILWEWKGVKCKSMIDRLLIDKEKKEVLIVDIKTTSNFLDFRDSIEKYHYDRQLTFYSMALSTKIEELTGLTTEELDEFKWRMIIVAVDKKSTEIRVYEFSEETINKTLPEVVRLLEKAKWHIENDKFKYPYEYYVNGGYEII